MLIEIIPCTRVGSYLMDMMEKFWLDWIKADPVERPKLLKNVVKCIDEIASIKDKKMRRFTATNMMNSYFEDLYSVYRSVIERADGRIEFKCVHGVGHTIYSPRGKKDFVHGCCKDKCCKVKK